MKSEIIKELKSKHSHIYSVSDNQGTEYLFRSLVLSEVHLIENFITQSLVNTFELENLCLETCLLYPENLDLDDISPGVAKQIADEILRVSGIADAGFILESMYHTRERLSGDVVLDIKSYIISAMPSYSDKELDNFTLLELIEKLILAEKILTLQGQLAGIDQKVELSFEYLSGESEEAPEFSSPPPAKAKPTPKSELPDKEELIRRIQRENKEKYSTRETYTNHNAADEWQGFDAELLSKMEGQVDPSDPIARKLFGLE